MKRITANQYQTSERYYKLPKILFEDEKYMDMKLEVKVAYSKLPGKLLVNQVQVWKSGLDDLDKATPKTLEESSFVPSLPNTTTK